MQLPFTVVFEPPRLAARPWWFWALGTGLVACAALALFLLYLRPVSAPYYWLVRFRPEAAR